MEAPPWSRRRSRRTGGAARLITPDGYALTADASLAIVEKVLAGEVAPGAHTPAGALGSDFVLSLDGVVRDDLP